MSHRRLAEVVWHASIFIAEEMGAALRRTALSPNIRDRMDFSCAILNQDGDLVAQAEHIPVHLGSMAVGVKAALAEAEREGVEPGPGDVIAVNDPYIAGTHLNDVLMIKPVYVGGSLLGFVASKAHYVDLGGSVPGGIGGAVDLYAEGLILPPVKIVRGGELDRGLLRLVSANSRTPEATAWDLRAQVASLNVGERLLAGLEGRYGIKAVRDSWSWALDYAERYARRALRELGLEGESEAEDYLELDGGTARIRARVSIGDGGVTVDFEGTDGQVDAPVNAVYGVTVAASVYAVKSIVDPEMPMNSGFERVMEVRAPRGSLVNPVKPAPVGAGNVETSQRIVDVVYKALARLAPHRVPAASCGSMNNLALGGRGWAFYETIGCGSGGRPCCDGVDGVHTNMTNTMNTPVEVVEREYPLLVVEYRLRSGSGGAGKYRGGLGIVRAIKALEDGVTASVVGERVRLRPWGLQGGLPGAPAEYLVIRRDGRVERLPSKARVTLARGDVIVVKTAGGGGWGDPRERPRELVERDLAEGKISVEEAARLYGYRPRSTQE